MERFVWICIGSAVGGGARYLVSGWALKVLGTSFPYGTLVVNVIGSFLISGIMFASVEAALIPRPAVAVAFALAQAIGHRVPADVEGRAPRLRRAGVRAADRHEAVTARSGRIAEVAVGAVAVRPAAIPDVGRTAARAEREEDGEERDGSAHEAHRLWRRLRTSSAYVPRGAIFRYA